VASDPAASYVSPYDDPKLWQGHSSLIAELAAHPALAAKPPSHIVASVRERQHKSRNAQAPCSSLAPSALLTVS